MKYLLPIVLLCLSLCVAGRAQNSATPSPTSVAGVDSREADHDALRALLKQATAAVNARDSEALAACFAEDFVFTTMTQQVVRSAADHDALQKELFDGDAPLLRSLKVEPQASILTVFTSADTGYCYGVSDETYVTGAGETVTLQTNWTATVVRVDGVWKASTVAVTLNPLDNPVFNQLSKAVGKSMLVSLVLGILLGGVIASLFIRKKATAEPTSQEGATV